MRTQPDALRDLESQNDLARDGGGEHAGIGDSITIPWHQAGPIKVTLLEFVDPAPEDMRPVSVARLMGGLHGGAGGGRTVAVRIKLRNQCEDPGAYDRDQSVVPVPMGYVEDGAGQSATGMPVGGKRDGYGSVSMPEPGEPSVVGWFGFDLPPGFAPERFVFSLSTLSRQAAWKLDHALAAAPKRASGRSKPSALDLLRQGADVWNDWRRRHPREEVDLSGAVLDTDLSHCDLRGVRLDQGNLAEATLNRIDFSAAYLVRTRFGETRNCTFKKADLRGAIFTKAYCTDADFDGADLGQAAFLESHCHRSRFVGANLSRVKGHEARFWDCRFDGARFDGADFTDALLMESAFPGTQWINAKLAGAILSSSDLSGSEMRESDLHNADMSHVDLKGATIIDCDLSQAGLVGAAIDGATIANTRVFGVSAWAIRGQAALQRDLCITRHDEAAVYVADLEVAQFVHLLLTNQKIRSMLQAVGDKGVLILGRFSPERKAVLEALRDTVRDRGYVPMIFDFERAENRDFSETIMTLAGLCRYIIADITNPKSSPLELHSIVPNYMIPLVTIIQEGETPFAMFQDLWTKHADWVLEPLRYRGTGDLIAAFEPAIEGPALERDRLLRLARAQRMGFRTTGDYL